MVGDHCFGHHGPLRSASHVEATVTCVLIIHSFNMCGVPYVLAH
jgi:hypothetical protein